MQGTSAATRNNPASSSCDDDLFIALDQVYGQALDAIERHADTIGLLERRLVDACGLDRQTEAILAVHPELSSPPHAIFLRLARLSTGLVAARRGISIELDVDEILCEWPADMRISAPVAREALLPLLKFARTRSLRAACDRVLSACSAEDGAAAANRATNQILNALLAQGQDMVVMEQRTHEIVFTLRIDRDLGDLPWHLPHDQLERLVSGVEGFATLAAIDGKAALAKAMSATARSLRTNLQATQYRYESDERMGSSGTLDLTFKRDTIEVGVSLLVAEAFVERASNRPRPILFLRK